MQEHDVLEFVGTGLSLIIMKKMRDGYSDFYDLHIQRTKEFHLLNNYVLKNYRIVTTIFRGEL